ncbi:MAG: HPF/RaiA family ribosome-associated protein [Kofleriaceae bacterium]|nr:HPF/RaiA family ribosome-associated protein [Kofleriaceae bacterium]
MSMKLNIRTHGIALSRTQRHMIERRVRFALTKFGATISEVDCLLGDLNGPRGGIDKLCVLRLCPSGARRVVIEQTSEHVQEALDVAVERAARAVARGLKRGRPRRALG